MKNIVLTGVSNGNNLGNYIYKNFRSDVPCRIHTIGIERRSLFHDDSFHYCDLSKKDFEEEFKNKIRQIGPVDILINCAGMNRLQWFSEMDMEDFDKIQNVNFRSPLILTKLLLDQLTKAEGTVLNIISKGADVPFRTSLAYNTSKAALAMATRQLARELTGDNKITVFGISPNELSGTDLTKQIAKSVEKVRGWSEQKVKEMQLGATLNGELTDPNELAKFIVYLLKDKQNHKMLSGAILNYGI